MDTFVIANPWHYNVEVKLFRWTTHITVQDRNTRRFYFAVRVQLQTRRSRPIVVRASVLTSLLFHSVSLIYPRVPIIRLSKFAKASVRSRALKHRWEDVSNPHRLLCSQTLIKSE